MLIYSVAHHVTMFGYFVIAFILLVGPLAYLAGKDSRIDEIHSRRRNFG